MKASNKRIGGFTLLEMAIVMGIIGLIMGGIVVGKDLIGAALITKQVKQIAEFDMGTNSFQLKYNCLPGDCVNASALGFGTVSTDWGNPVNGNGDGIVSCSSPYPGSSCGGNNPDSLGENYNYWYHLYQANLIPAYLCLASANCPGTNGWGLLGLMTPQPKMPYMGNTYYSHPYLAGGIGIQWTGNYNSNSPAVYQVNSPQVYMFGDIINGVWAGAFRPSDIYALDSKMDDGLPGSGRITTWWVAYTTAYRYVNYHGGGGTTCTDNSSGPSDGIAPTHYLNDNNFECVGFVVQTEW